MTRPAGASNADDAQLQARPRSWTRSVRWWRLVSAPASSRSACANSASRSSGLTSHRHGPTSATPARSSRRGRRRRTTARRRRRDPAGRVGLAAAPGGGSSGGLGGGGPRPAARWPVSGQLSLATRSPPGRGRAAAVRHAQPARPHGGWRDDQRQVLDAADSAGFTVVDQRPGSPDEVAQSPAEVADGIEAKTWSSLWDLTDEQWRTVVAPTVAALRALPDAHVQRRYHIPSGSSCCNDDELPRRLRRLATRQVVAEDGPRHHPSWTHMPRLRGFDLRRSRRPAGA
jgi:hypothetical protein